MLAGLVAITASGAFVNPLGAVIIGAISGVIGVVAVWFFDARGVDDQRRLWGRLERRRS